MLKVDEVCIYWKPGILQSPIQVKQYNETHPDGVPCQPHEIPCRVCIEIIVHAIQAGFEDARREEQAQWN